MAALILPFLPLVAFAFEESADNIACQLIVGDEAADFNCDGVTDGRDIQAFVDQQKCRVAASHPLAARYIADRKIWLDRWSKATVTYSVADRIDRAVAAAEYQAATGDASYEWQLLNECPLIVTTWPAVPDAYQVYVTNPEPQALKLARIALLSPKARNTLRPLLESLLERLRTGTHGWNVNYGKVSLCRVRLQQALGVPCDPLADYGANKGGRWMLWNMVNEWGWNLSLSGSPWYMIFNEVLVQMLWDERHRLTPGERKTFMAIYLFPFYWQLEGRAPLIGEDREQNREKPYALWTGYPRQWRGTGEISTYMRWRALYELGVAAHWDDLFCPPTPIDKPAMPPLPRYRYFGFAAILEEQGIRTLHYYGDPTHLRITESHVGANNAFAKTTGVTIAP
ncbi:MAG: hypothetical protein KF841_14310 [Phycisphaerae bacterium]|nr:hypothetical protein [Phycisphaerae bacterium]